MHVYLSEGGARSRATAGRETAGYINLINRQPIQAGDTNADIIIYRSASTQADISHAHGSTAINSYQFQIAFIFPQLQIPSGAVQAQIIAMLLMGTEFTPPLGSAFDVLLGRDVLCRGVFSMSFDGHGVLSL
jgi:hypothetical protein